MNNKNGSKAEEKKEDSTSEFQANPVELLGSPDLSQLVYLEMKNVLINCEYRFSTTNPRTQQKKRKNCYTSISTILLAINPYETLPIYGKDVIDVFHTAAKNGRLPKRPHPYGVSARAYMRMVQRKTNQSVIVCGESGAGKTVTTKLLMRYLAMTAPTASMESSMVEEQIIAASPILEAYGNAKTVMNNNSSRFGKFTKLLYSVPTNNHHNHNQNQSAYILGAFLETYLLEKSRVVFQTNNERNYHIPYFLYSGLMSECAAAAAAEEYGLLHDCSEYTYTNQGRCPTVPGVNDFERYKELVSSLQQMRIDAELRTELWQLTLGIFNLGNVVFRAASTDGGYAEIAPRSERYVRVVAKLWGIPVERLVARLTTASLKIPGAGRGKNKVITKKLSVADAVVNRDSIAKGVYENIFLWLCARINTELFDEDQPQPQSAQPHNNGDNENGSQINGDGGRQTLSIGILDVFGFENFWVNSLEQFCINFTNEKLQQYFNGHIIQSEQEEYIAEGVFWKPLVIPENDRYMRMVEKKKTGFFALLDSACLAPQPDPAALMQEVFRHHGENPALKRVQKPGSGGARGKPRSKKLLKQLNARFAGFEIAHFADAVSYDVGAFLSKNMEAVHPDTARLMTQSKKQLVKYIGGTQNFVASSSSKSAHGNHNNNVSASTTKKSRRRSSNKKRSVTAVFFSGIKTLMKSLNATEPYFVRCVNPNTKKSSKLWNEKYVRHQLKCGGLVEALKVLKLGYPTRVLYSTLYNKFYAALARTNPLIKNMDARAFSAALLIAFDVNAEHYELGLSKIFFKPAKAAVLDSIMANAGQPLTAAQNRKITDYIVQKRIQQMIGGCKAFLTLRRRVRMTRAVKNFAYAGRVSAILGGTVYKTLALARQQILERKKHAAAKKMQSFFRGYGERTQHVQKVAQMKHAVKVVWDAFGTYRKQQGLQAFLDGKVHETRAAKAAAAKREGERAAAAQALQATEERDAALAKLRAQQQQQHREDEEQKQRELLASQRAPVTLAVLSTVSAANKEANHAIEAKSKTKTPKTRIAEEKKEFDVEDEAGHGLIQKTDVDGDVGVDVDDTIAVAAAAAAELDDERLRAQIEAQKQKQQRIAPRIARDRQQEKIARIRSKRRRKEKRVRTNAAHRKSADTRVHRNGTKQKRKRKRKSKDNDDNDDDEEYYTEYTTDEYNTTDYEDGDEEDNRSSAMFDVDAMLQDFVSIAKFGQLFVRHTARGPRRTRVKTQDRMIKISFHSRTQRPTELAWGGGNRHLRWQDIRYVQQGCATPVFHLQRERQRQQSESNTSDGGKSSSHIGPGYCFSVVSSTQVLDLQSHSKEICELWVKGIRKLLGHANDDATEQRLQREAQSMFESGNLPGMAPPPSSSVGDGEGGGSSMPRSEKLARLEKVAKLQQDLFIMTMHTVFRQLAEERIWEIDEDVHEEFQPKKYYLMALKKDIPWRQWNDWIRQQITAYCVQTNKVIQSLATHGRQSVVVNMPVPHQRQSSSVSNLVYTNTNNNVNAMHPPLAPQRMHSRNISTHTHMNHNIVRQPPPPQYYNNYNHYNNNVNLNNNNHQPRYPTNTSGMHYNRNINNSYPPNVRSSAVHQTTDNYSGVHGYTKNNTMYQPPVVYPQAQQMQSQPQPQPPVYYNTNNNSGVNPVRNSAAASFVNQYGAATAAPPVQSSATTANNNGMVVEEVKCSLM